RLPRASYNLLPTPIGETPLLLSLRAGITHFYRTGDVYEDVNSDKQFEIGEPARIYRRFDVGAGVSAPLEAAGLQVTPRLAFRQLVYDANLPGFAATRAHLVLGGDIAAPFSRIFGAPAAGPAPIGSWMHVIEPVIAYRYVPATYERGAGIASVTPGLDDLDN